MNDNSLLKFEKNKTLFLVRKYVVRIRIRKCVVRIRIRKCVLGLGLGNAKRSVKGFIKRKKINF